MTDERLYVASKTHHAPMWRDLRDRLGWPIVSTWLDEAGQGETDDFTDLWQRNIDEARHATGLILYGEPGEIITGALVETGAALAMHIPVAVVGTVETLKTARAHPLIFEADSLESARLRLWWRYISMRNPELAST